MPSFFSVGRPTTEFGSVRIVSSPRDRSTRPVSPVRIVSPGFSIALAVNETGSASAAATQTSPDDLLTVQAASSARVDCPGRKHKARPSKDGARSLLVLVHLDAILYARRQCF